MIQNDCLWPVLHVKFSMTFWVMISFRLASCLIALDAACASSFGKMVVELGLAIGIYLITEPIFAGLAYAEQREVARAAKAAEEEHLASVRKKAAEEGASVNYFDLD